MHFLVDECTGPKVAQWLRKQNHEVFSVYDEAKGLSDDDIIQKAFKENWILITNDKDFGEKIFRQKKLHKGIILLRLKDERPIIKIQVLQKLIERFSNKLNKSFIVSTETQIRFVHK